MAMSIKERKKRYRLRHPDRIRAAQRLMRLKNLSTKYGLTPDAYKAMYAGQDGRCAACGDPQTLHYVVDAKKGEGICVDHDHATGTVRGLLCPACNKSLGLLGDSLQRIEGLFNYLWRQQAGAR